MNLNSYHKALEILEGWENKKENQQSVEISNLKQSIISKIKEDEYYQKSMIAVIYSKLRLSFLY
jgi:hypothetical protein